jgi:hypothetical protein
MVAPTLRANVFEISDLTTGLTRPQGCIGDECVNILPRSRRKYQLVPLSIAALQPDSKQQAIAQIGTCRILTVTVVNQ